MTDEQQKALDALDGPLAQFEWLRSLIPRYIPDTAPFLNVDDLDEATDIIRTALTATRITKEQLEGMRRNTGQFISEDERLIDRARNALIDELLEELK